MKKLKKLLKVIGPGFITGASDDDPSGIGTYSQTGAMFGYSQLWTSLFTLPLTIAVQEMCGRIGVVTGKGLAGVIKKHYSKTLLYIAVLMVTIANTINIGADLGAMAASIQLIVSLPFLLILAVITAISIILQVFVPYHVYSKFLKYFTFSLFAYFIVAFIVKQDWLEALRSTIIPTISLNKDYLFNIVAVFGTTISPYLFFWQASEEVEEEVEEGKLKNMDVGKPNINFRDIKNLRMDTYFGMFFSNLVMFFIILTTASTLNKFGIKDIETADQAAQALKPLAGNLSSLLFALGIIGTGFLAVPILAGSVSYAVSETFGIKEGLYRKLSQAKGFYAIITIATLTGLAINFLKISPFKLLYYTAVLNGLCAPLLLVIILLISNNRKIMNNYTNTKISNILGIIITLIMSVAGITLIVNLISG